MRSKSKYVGVAITAWVCCCGTVGAATSGELLQQALYAEQIEGDLPTAIASYKQVVNDANASSNHVAQALYREGVCYLQLKQEEKAVMALTRLMNQYPEQTELVKQAESMLDELLLFDPAALMPSGTLAYFEMGDIGGQVETIFEMLKGTPLEDPLLAMMQSDPDMLSSGAGPIMAGLLNPAMKAEFQKIRGLAVGLVDIHSSVPGVVGVMHLGDSTMLRGLLMTALSMGGTPGPTIEGLKTYTVQGQVAIASDNNVFLFSFMPESLPEMIKKYKHLSDAPSLASAQPGLARSREVRGKNLATLWVDVDTLYSQLAPSDPSQMNTFAPDAIISESVLGIDDLLMSASFSTNAVSIESRLRSNKGEPNKIYDMFRTPPLSRDGFKGVPSGAFFLASVALSQANAAQLQSLLTMAMGTPLPDGFLENIEQITLFALPGKTVALDMPFRPGFVLKCKQASVALETIQQILQQIPEGPPIIAVEGDHQTALLMLDAPVEMASHAAMDPNKSVMKNGELHNALQSQLGSAGKLVLVNASGLAHMVQEDNDFFFGPIASEQQARDLSDAYDQLAQKLENTMLSVHTEEQSNELVLNLKISGIPAISTLIPTIQNIAQMESQIEAQWRQEQLEETMRLREEHLAKLVPAKVVRTSAAPTIDGEMDEVWTQSDLIPVSKWESSTPDVLGKPMPNSEFAAAFRRLWDADNFYFYLYVTDNTPNKNPELDWYHNDNAVLYIDATDAKSSSLGATDYQFIFQWDESAPTLTENEHEKMDGVVYKIKNTGKGYCIEAAFPWETLGTPSPGAGTTIGMDVHVSDNQSGSERNALIGWQDDTDNAWQYPYLWGRAVLEGLKE